MKKSRKKILLSSIAMLLVALVALGSATFAWFTVNKIVTADKMKVQAIAADGLVINNARATAGNWGPKVSFADSATSLQPVSYNVALNAAMPTGYIAKDVKEDGGAVWGSAADDSKVSNFVEAPALPNATYSDSTYKFNSNDNVARYDVDVASSGAAINKTVNVEISAKGAGKTYAKAALVKDNKVIAFYTDGETYKAITSTNPTAVDAIAASGSVQAMASVPVKTEAQAFQLYVWYEGNDPQCLDDNGGENSPAEFTLTFTLAN